MHRFGGIGDLGHSPHKNVEQLTTACARRGLRRPFTRFELPSWDLNAENYGRVGHGGALARKLASPAAVAPVFVIGPRR